MLTQYAFLTTSLACLAQVICGHRRAIIIAVVAVVVVALAATGGFL